MIRVIESKKCCGCNACIDSCPKQCINTIIDEEGFKYPIVDTSKCIDCHICEKLCPMLNSGEPTKPISVEAMIYQDDEKRLESSSGGIFTAISEEVIRRGGVVFGASYTDDWHLVHSQTENIQDLSKYRGSKYFQCDTLDSFKKVRNYLNDDRWVLYSGTPCQIRGLLLFLGKQYEKLITLDFICHGVPNRELLLSYVRGELIKYANKNNIKKIIISSHNIIELDKGDPSNVIKLENVRFRDKRKGWKNYSFSIDVVNIFDKKKSIISIENSKCPFMIGYGLNIFLRPSCYECPAKNFTSGSDITLADFWGIDNVLPKMDDDLGTSLISINSEKALLLFDSIIRIKRKKVEFEKSYSLQTALFHSMSKPLNRDLFWEKEWKDDFSNVVLQFVPKKTKFEKLVYYIKYLLRFIGIKKLIKKFR